jgi:hypothetical protein
MIIRILGDSQRNYDGKLQAQFLEDEKQLDLYFNLDEWENIMDNGVISGDRIQTLQPENVCIEFDREYEVDVDFGGKIFKLLKQNGWKETQQLL